MLTLRRIVGRGIAALALSCGLILASGSAGFAYPDDPPSGGFLGAGTAGPAAGQPFHWVVPTPRTSRMRVTVTNQAPSALGGDDITIAGMKTATMSTPGGTYSVALTLTSEGEHQLTAEDADTGETLAQASVTVRADVDEYDPNNVVTVEPGTATPPTSSHPVTGLAVMWYAVGGALLCAGGLVALLTPRRAKRSIPRHAAAI